MQTTITARHCEISVKLSDWMGTEIGEFGVAHDAAFGNRLQAVRDAFARGAI